MIIFSVTLFTFAKMSIFCGKRDLRIKLSPIWTMINFLLSSFQIFVLGYLVSHHLKHHPINPSDSKAVVSWMHYHVQDFYHAVIGLHLTSGRVNVVKTALVLTVWQKPVKTIEFWPPKAANIGWNFKETPQFGRIYTNFRWLKPIFTRYYQFIPPGGLNWF